MELPDDLNDYTPQQLDTVLSQDLTEQTPNILPHEILVLQPPEPSNNINQADLMAQTFEQKPGILDTNQDDDLNYDLFGVQGETLQDEQKNEESIDKDKIEGISEIDCPKPVAVISDQFINQQQQNDSVEQNTPDQLNVQSDQPELIKEIEQPKVLSLNDQLNQMDNNNKFEKKFDKFETVDIIVEKEILKPAMQSDKPKISIATIIDDPVETVPVENKKGCCAGM